VASRSTSASPTASRSTTGTVDADRIRTLIVDDEVAARAGLRALLEADPEILVVGEFGDGRSAERAVADLHPDLVFLDVQMPEIDGFAMLERIAPEHMPAVVFVTAYDRYALRAFEIDALDYLLKPFDDERFRRALDRAKNSIRQGRVRALSRKLVALLERMGDPGAAATNAAADAVRHREARAKEKETSRYFERLAIRSGGRVFFLRVDEIDWIEADDDHVRLHVTSRTFVLRETMQDLERRLNPSRFVRIHRSTIVNLNRIKELQRHFHGEYGVLLVDGTELKLSRGYRANLESRIGRGL
jgi:two-component system LytT family response regulator